ncbi:adenomatous polyposis coli homolog [Aethina tumida]|uniref:adenomatous polyposis coli homolog n=1 Tax=Aethina tumida TaxID=116153 RepID=UPI002149738E|nr:adenomatous polyposis coli homolog [Aethina tumida]XP_049821339.1 adenomatous polyposis coli homolog [Aethina tumida]
MSLPVSQYEALLAEVRDLRKKAQRVQQLARPLYNSQSTLSNNDLDEPSNMDSLLVERQVNSQTSKYDRGDGSSSTVTETEAQCPPEEQYKGAHMSVSNEPISHRNRSSLYHGTWPVERTTWNSEPTSLGTQTSTIHSGMDVTSVMSFASSSGGVPLERVLVSPDTSRRSSQQLEAKMDMVYSLLAVLGGQEHADMGETLLALSTNLESCLAMRQSGCIPLLVQLVQSEKDVDTKKKASQALRNLVHSQPDEKIRKREIRILKLLEQTGFYTDALRYNTDYLPENSSSNEDGDKHPVQIMTQLMKLSFDEDHRQIICQLGGIHAIATLVETENARHGSTSSDSQCILMRRYACMVLTNLTFGDSGNKTLLCSFREFMRALVVQLQSTSDELRQVTASVLRNLSWRADSTSKDILREVGSVTGLMKSAMLENKENTLKSILSALWNLSAHCTENKSEICAVEGALGFLVDMLTYKTSTKSLVIVENSGGILRNISSQIAVRDDYREILRKHNCLQILIDQLKSPSLTIVSNACGALWNLSAKCAVDQEALWQMGAPAMLRSLNHSKHKMIAMGSTAALKNLLSARPQQSIISQMDSTALNLDLPVLPTLGARKQKALLQDLDNNLSELFSNIEKVSIPTNDFIQKSSHHKSQHDFTTTRSTIDTDDLTNSFVSLNINEPSTSYAIPQSDSRIPQSYGSTSLPYMTNSIQTRVPSTSSTFIPVVRNNFSDCAYENEIDASDQPIDYSQKYSETNVIKAEPDETEPDDEDSFIYNNKSKSDEESFGIYAETDLDQPTDYSLRYAEDDSDSDQCKKSPKDVPTAFIHDTVKTYCTEDTPYETPFNFSTATSMSDLRMEEKPVVDNDKSTIDVPQSKENKNEDEKERCSNEDISGLENLPKSCDKIPKSEFSSGLLSPEKPINYCEEGTPGYFSRVSSFGSLNSIPANETLKDEVKEEAYMEPEVEEKTVEKQVKNSTEVKVVKFEQTVNYAEQTPLMFSRSSSLESLGSIEQHSIHDDRSSVVSDLSRLTSGIVSPSELPDSPTQTVPPSPKPRKVSPEFPFNSKSRPGGDMRPQPVPRNISKPSVFEDHCTKFKEESTPVQFSTATSLSSLTIDDQDELTTKPVIECPILNVEESAVKPEQNENKDVEKESNIPDVNDELTQESEDDEDILAACIYIGMQNNRYNNVNSSSSTLSKLPIYSHTYQNKPHSSETLLPKSMTRLAPVGLTTDDQDELTSQPAIENIISNVNESAVKAEQNEKKDVEKKSNISDVNDELVQESEDDEDILAACIYLGMQNNRYNNVNSSSPTPSKLPIYGYKYQNKLQSSESLMLESMTRVAPVGHSSSPNIDTQTNSLSIDDQDELSSQLTISKLNESALKPEQNEKKDEEKESNLSVLNDELAAQESENDEDILAACIHIGMQNNRYNSSSSTPSKLPIYRYKYQNKPQSSGIPLPKSMTRVAPVGHSSPPPIDTVKTYYTEDTPAILSHAGSNSDLSNLSFPTNDNKSKKDYLSDDSSSLSGDNDLLAECIQLGMPKYVNPVGKRKTTCLPRRSPPLKYDSNENIRIVTGESSKLQKDNRRPNVALHGYMSAKEELESYRVGNSSTQFCLRSSLGDLTINGSVAGLTRQGGFENNEFESNNQPCLLTSGNSEEPLNISNEHNVGVGDRESLSSISVESLESLEAEQALLEQCILLGMRKITAASTLTATKPLESKPVGIATKQFSRQTTGDDGLRTSTGTSPVDERHKQKCECCANKNSQRGHHSGSRRRRKSRTRDNRPQVSQSGRDPGKYIPGQILAYRRDELDISKEEWI